MAVGLGSVDMPVPSVAEWEWLNWKFPRPVHAGDTLYARWTLTQKRPPVGGSPTAIVVWRVDVHTTDGALCAEGEVGAKVKRNGAVVAHKPAEGEVPAAAAARRSRRGRRSRGNGAPAAVPETPAIAAPPAAAAKPERTSTGSSRRRRRRRSGAGTARDEEHEPRAAHVQETVAPPPATVPAAGPAASRSSGSTSRRGIGGVLRRLRGS